MSDWRSLASVPSPARAMIRPTFSAISIPPNRLNSSPVRRRITAAEAAVARLSAEIAGIDARLAESGLFARDPAKAASLAKTRADHANALAKAEEDWLEASAEFEKESE